MTTSQQHPPAPADHAPRIALVGSPNSGKTSVFNQLTGLRAKTGNYPGVTVARSVGKVRHRNNHDPNSPDSPTGAAHYSVEDLPGCYSLHPVSPDERIVTDLLTDQLPGISPPDAIAVVIDATVVERSLSLLAQVLALGKPTMVIMTMTDELIARGGYLDISRFAGALGVPVMGVIASRGRGFAPLKALLAAPHTWSRTPIAPPGNDAEFTSWVASVLAAGRYRPAEPDRRSARIDRVLLHPLFGSLTFLAVMFMVFQAIFTLALPAMDFIDQSFAMGAEAVNNSNAPPVIAGLIGTGIIGGVGAVVVFIPQIVLMFLLISLLENIGYMARAAFLVDRLMAFTGLEGRAFVAMLSSMACAIPGIMATRTLPSSRDRIATTMAAPLMVCSARLPVYILLIGLLIDPEIRWGPVSLQGIALFGLYLLGGLSSMIIAWLFKSVVLGSDALPFYMELPPYRFPAMKSVLLVVWDCAKAFLHKAGTIILATSIVLWFLLNLPLRSAETAGMDQAAANAYNVEHSFAASIGKLVQPIFEPLGFDWRICVGLIGAMAAREVFVATMGQIFAANDIDDPSTVIQSATWTSTHHHGELLFTAPTTVALLIFFAYALLCMSTVAVIRRETNSWKWPLVAWGYMFILAWVAALIARNITMWAGG